MNIRGCGDDMNLYKIIFSHICQKDSVIGIKKYVVAQDEIDVYDYIDKNYNYGCWKDKEECKEMFDVYNDNSEVIGKQTFKEKILGLRGEIEDEDYDYSDAYYGITLWGWEIVKENIMFDMNEFVDLGIVEII